MRLGILGLKNNDNGHPFSFSAIINGYNKSKFKKTRYKNILKYLDKKPQKDFGIKGVKITHAWTQNKNLTKSLTLFNCSYNKILVKRKNINEIKNYIECA